MKTDSTEEAVIASMVQAMQIIGDGDLNSSTARYDLQVRISRALREAADTIARLRAALTKIDAIRADIVGRQTVGWSNHIYPLVAALDEAGFPGPGYEEARAKAFTTNDLIAKLEAELSSLKAAGTRADGIEAAAAAVQQAITELGPGLSQYDRGQFDGLRTARSRIRALSPAPEAKPVAAIEALRSHQIQLDQDGVQVGVSRQALEEVLSFAERKL